MNRPGFKALVEGVWCQLTDQLSPSGRRLGAFDIADRTGVSRKTISKHRRIMGNRNPRGRTGSHRSTLSRARWLPHDAGYLIGFVSSSAPFAPYICRAAEAVR